MSVKPGFKFQNRLELHFSVKGYLYHPVDVIETTPMLKRGEKKKANKLFNILENILQGRATHCILDFLHSKLVIVLYNTFAHLLPKI